MFLIFGFRTRAERLGLVPGRCQVCGHSENLLLLREVTKFSLFFIPLIPVRRKYVAQCTNPMCGARFGVDADQARRLQSA